MNVTDARTGPIYTTGPGGPRGRLLLISYHFPPSRASGALRWQKLARYVIERGWGLDVVCAAPWDLPAAEPARLEDLPDGVRLYAVEDHELWFDRAVDRGWSHWRSLVTRHDNGADPRVASTVRRHDSLSRHEVLNAAWESRDAVRAFHAWRHLRREASWAKRAAAVARAVIDPALHRAVITCGPPHWPHVAGAQLSRATRLPLVVDMRDPWSLWERLPEWIASPVWYGTVQRLERQVMSQAALVVMNTEAARRAMVRVYPSAADRTTAVLNGWDDDDLPARTARHRMFVVAYAGTIYLDRDAGPLLAAAARVIRTLRLTPDCFGLEFMGHVERAHWDSPTELAATQGIGAFVRTHPPRGRREALSFLADASVLVSLPQDSHLAVPAKIYEYLRFRSWLLTLAEQGSATADVLRDTRADVVQPYDIDEIACVLRRRYEAFCRGEQAPPLVSNDRLSRRAQAAHLLEALERVVDAAATRPARA